MSMPHVVALRPAAVSSKLPMPACTCLRGSDVREVLSRTFRNEGLCAADNLALALARLALAALAPLPLVLVEGTSRNVAASDGELSSPVLLLAATLEHLHDAWLLRPELERPAWVQVRAPSINSR